MNGSFYITEPFQSEDHVFHSLSFASEWIETVGCSQDLRLPREISVEVSV